MTETLDDLLNKVEAIIKCRAGTYDELHKATKKPLSSLYDLIGGPRRFKPNGDITLKIQTWAAKKTTQIAIGLKETQSAYRAAYQEIREKRSPVGGRK